MTVLSSGKTVVLLLQYKVPIVVVAHDQIQLCWQDQIEETNQNEKNWRKH